MATVPQPEEFSLLAKWAGAVLGGVATVAAGLFGIVVKGFDTKLKEIDVKASNAVPKEDFKEHLKHDEKMFEEVRGTLRELFQAAERDRALASERHAELTKLIYERTEK